MNVGMNKINARRMWVVPDFAVWGISGLGEVEYLTVEEVGSTKSVFFGSVGIGGSSQAVSFAALIDMRGNSLPETINRPLVTFRSHGESQVFVVGSESNTGFKIARDPKAAGPVMVDLIITELGE
jgi:hypothetical protein